MASLLSKVVYKNNHVSVDLEPFLKGIEEFECFGYLEGMKVSATYKGETSDYVVTGSKGMIGMHWAPWREAVMKERKQDILNAEKLEVSFCAYTHGKEHTYGGIDMAVRSTDVNPYDKGHTDFAIFITPHPFVPHSAGEEDLDIRIDLTHVSNIEKKRQKMLDRLPSCTDGSCVHNGQTKNVDRIEVYSCRCSYYQSHPHRKNKCSHHLVIKFRDGIKIQSWSDDGPSHTDLIAKGYLPHIVLTLPKEEEYRNNMKQHCPLVSLVPPSRHEISRW